MTFPRHGEPPNEASKISMADMLKRFQDQVNGRAQRAYSEGRLCGADEGDLACAVTADREHNRIIMDFGKAVTWLAMTPEQAVAWAEVLIVKARSISKEPIVVKL